MSAPEWSLTSPLYAGNAAYLEQFGDDALAPWLSQPLPGTEVGRQLVDPQVPALAQAHLEDVLVDWRARVDLALDPVDAVLVSPGEFASPMWIGELRFERSVAGRPVYAARSVRPLPGSGAAIAATDSEVEPPSRFAIDPALRGAPFVTLDGVVLGLYLGDGEGRPRSVPMALVREALSGLGRRAAS